MVVQSETPKAPMALMSFVPDRFVLLMILAIILAVLFPEWGLADGPLHLGTVTAIGIGLVFFLHGANLAPDKLAAGVRQWRAHILIQAMTFLVFPIAGLILFFGLGSVLPETLLLGFFFLAALPSTISSAVALTAVAGGNVPIAVFNATLSGLLGMILTPAMISLVTAASTAPFSLLDAMGSIAMTLLAPFVAGQLLRPVVAPILKRFNFVLGKLDRAVIVLIVFGSFASSTAGGLWLKFTLVQFSLVLIISALMLFGALVVSTLAARWLDLGKGEEAAVVFCGSTKSIANGAPIAQILFAGSPSLGVLILPLLMYHQLQLMAGAVLAQRYARAHCEGQTAGSRR